MQHLSEADASLQVRVGNRTTFLIKLTLNQAEGSSARFAFGRPGFCHELVGGVFRFSGERAEILIPYQCLKQSIHGASGGQMSRQASCREARKRNNRREGEKKHHQSELIHHVKLSELHYNRHSVWRN